MATQKTSQPKSSSSPSEDSSGPSNIEDYIRAIDEVLDEEFGPPLKSSDREIPDDWGVPGGPGSTTVIIHPPGYSSAPTKPASGSEKT
jgi:hypothetical protein